MKNLLFLAFAVAILCFSYGDSDIISSSSSKSSLVDQAMLQGSWKPQSFRVESAQTHEEAEIPMNFYLEAQRIEVQEKNIFTKLAHFSNSSCSYDERSGSYVISGDKLTFIGDGFSKEFEIKRITDNSVQLKMVIDGSIYTSQWIKE